LKFTSCDNQTLVGCIPISAVAVQLVWLGQKLVIHVIISIAITFVTFKSLRQFLVPVQRKSGNLWNAPRSYAFRQKLLLTGKS